MQFPPFLFCPHRCPVLPAVSMVLCLQHHGSTDKLVAVSTLEHYGIPKEVRTTPTDCFLQRVI